MVELRRVQSEVRARFAVRYVALDRWMHDVRVFQPGLWGSISRTRLGLSPLGFWHGGCIRALAHTGLILWRFRCKTFILANSTVK